MGKRSNIWRFFNKQDSTSTFATCSLCKHQYKSSGNTSNLFDHLKRKHPIEYKNLQHKNEEENLESDNTETETPPRLKIRRTLKNYFNRHLNYTDNDPKKIKLDRLLVKMVCEDFEPFSFVNHTGFKMFVKELNPRYQIPSSSDLKERLFPSIYEEVKKKLMDVLNEVDYISLTTDMWTSPSNTGILTLTSHFIYNKTLKSAVLKTVRMEDHHTGQNISQVIHCAEKS